MWTHLQPYLNDDFTADSIARHARVGLWRSINLHRLIGFTGSGVTLAHGFPTWTETAALFINATIKQIEQAYPGSNFASPDCEALILQINRLSQSASPKKAAHQSDRHQLHPAPVDCNYADIAQTLMDLCEELLKKLPEPDAGGSHLELARASFATGFLNGDERNCIRKLESLFEPHERASLCDNAAPDMTPLWETGDDGDLLLSALRPALTTPLSDTANTIIKGKVGHLWQRAKKRDRTASGQTLTTETGADSAETCFYKPETRDSDTDTARDPINAILGDLGIRRVLTLNYDVQLERWIRHKQRIPRIGNDRGFNDLCAAATDGNCPSVDKHARIEVKSGVSRTAVSVSLNRENIGDLINFGAYSGAFEHQIFHLHGRADLADQIVATEKDYRQVYLQKELSQQAFEAAQEAVFGGNDVLFMGVGMTEVDVLRPFRRFVSRGRAHNHLPRKTFALMPSATGPDWREKNDKRAVNSAIRYDVYTLFFGGPKFRAISELLQEFVKFPIVPDANFQERVEKQYRAYCSIRKKIAELEKTDAKKGRESKLLTEYEFQLIRLATKKSRPLDAFQVRLINLLGKELLTRVTSRALVYELKDLKQGARDWWSYWRDAPHERMARFHIADKEHAGESNYLWTRHRNDLGVGRASESAKSHAITEIRKAIMREFEWAPPGSEQPEKTPTFESLQKNLKRTNDGQELSGLRIVRMTSLRGGGKGTLVGLLHDKKFQQQVFQSVDHAGEPTSTPTYRASFLAHLSFSMEFNSVIKSLTRFLARQVAMLRVKTADQDLRLVQQAIVKELQSKAANDGDRTRRLRELTRLTLWYGKGSSREDITDRISLEMLKKSLILGKPNTPRPPTAALLRIANALFAHRCEDEPRLLLTLDDSGLAKWLEDSGVWTKEMLNKSTPREHRLDQLRDIMQRLQDATAGTKNRYFICLGGLDRLADQNGDAYNPSHRAFFRLLTGNETRSNTTKLTPPFDIVLVAGRPESPICYLSDDFGLSEEDQKKVAAIEIGDLQTYSWKSQSKRHIRKWYEFRPFDWQARVSFLVNNTTGMTSGEEQALSSIAEALRDIDSASLSRPPEDCFDAERAHRLLWQNLSLSHWAMTYWAVVGATQYCKPIDDAASTGQGAEAQKRADKDAAKRYLNDLDGAVALGGIEAVLNFLLDGYDTNVRAQNRRQADLIQHILRHLVLFALPVEPWVLLGCPMIYTQLLELYQEQFDRARYVYNKGRPEEQHYTPSREHAERALHDWHERAWMLGKLKLVLADMLKRGLILRIHPASHNFGHDGNDAMDKFLHDRFSVHGIMREHLSKRMQLPVIDGGDLNHHRMSVYCDQPRDLPTPSHEHFQLIEGVLDRLINRSRRTLRAIILTSTIAQRYAFSSWDPETRDDRLAVVLRAAARRYFTPDLGDIPPGGKPRGNDGILKDVLTGITGDELENWDHPQGLSGGLGVLHAVPQRLRACLSLIQGTFSIGALSRLDGVQASDGDTTPYDAYGAWLRSLTNAGTSLGRSRQEINDVLEGLTFVDGGTGPSNFIATNEDQARKEHEEHIHNTVKEIGFNKKQVSSFKKIRHPFYRDEIAWLYNERGLTALAQGNIFNALPLFEQASFVMSHQRTPNEDAHAYNAAERRIRLNYAIASIERGNLARAREVLDDLMITSAHVKGSTPSQTAGLAELYLSVCNHLTGGHQLAITGYKASIEKFVDNKQLRAVAIANRHYADILAVTDDPGGALKQINLAISASSQAEQRDILYFSTVSKARILIRGDGQDEAQALLRKAIEYAETMGLQSLLIDAKLAQSNLLFKRGDLSLAGQKAAEAVSIAVRNGLKLRKIGGIVALARAKKRQGHAQLATSLLLEAKTHAESLGYLTQAARATRYLSDIGSPEADLTL